MTSGDVVVHPDAETLAPAVAARLLVRLVDAQAARGEASLVLTGGGVASAVYRAVATSPARHAVDWSRVTVWWGDERFLRSGDPERNETQARQALGSLLDEARVHPMPASDGPDGEDPDAGAERYAAQLAAAGGPADMPPFDVLLLGVGEDGHVASIFPGAPAVHDTRPVCAVRDAPKPPPTRVTLTLPTIRHAQEVWLVAAGSGKAQAVGGALTDRRTPAGQQAPTGQQLPLPAAAVDGTQRTVWLLDRAAAADVPQEVRPSPPYAATGRTR